MCFTVSAQNELVVGIAFTILGNMLLFVVIGYIGKRLKVLMAGRGKAILHAAVGREPISGIFSSTATTVLLRSSPATTKLVVPLAGAVCSA